MGRFLLIILFLAGAGAGAFYLEQWNFFAPGPPAAHGNATIVLIKPREHSARIADELQRAGVIRNAGLFRVGIQLRGMQSNIKAGEYAIPSGASMADIAGIMMSGKSIQHKITAAEGLTSRMIYDMVLKNPVLVNDAGAEPPEGGLLPETYLFTRGTTREQILVRMKKAQQILVAKLWSSHAANLPLKSPEDAVILASIVEKETAIPEERRHIAAVFLNRLRLGMKLQSDPTIIYGITKGYPLGRGIRESELQNPTPYNTYAVAGLPPTPICNPGKDAIAAVLNPEDSKDLYFVANGTGGHTFSSSVVEHQKNVARWRQIERSLKTPTQTPLTTSVPDVNLTLRGTTDSEANTPPPPGEKVTSTPSPRHRHSHHHQHG